MSHNITNKNLLSLHGLRALSTIGIFLFHSGLLPNGTFPVTLFFMLSGFLMYYTKSNWCGSYKEWVKFYYFKKLKLFYPLHFLTFIMSIFIGKMWIDFSKQQLIRGALNVLLIHSFFKDYVFQYNGLSWYLSVTMFLYLISFFLLKIVNHIKKPSFAIIVIILVVLSINTANRFGADLYVYTNPIYRVLDFLLGMIISKAFMNNTITIKKSNFIEILLVFFFVVQYLLSLKIGYDPGYYSVLFAVSLYVFAVGEGCISRILSSKGLSVVSKYSFEIYMFHELCLRVFRPIFENVDMFYLIKHLIISLLGLVLTILCVLFYKYIEFLVKKRKKDSLWMMKS